MSSRLLAKSAKKFHLFLHNTICLHSSVTWSANKYIPTVKSILRNELAFLFFLS